ncbi:hypothetical protein B0J18DRAFT_476734 [Chaetomium sp. MPI-SDFR-AT-0129]|nr:hypothetical protein B0J18DRAFT_476734 [Chaetomium sp. MPI-SDFR-AT-0129]
MSNTTPQPAQPSQPSPTSPSPPPEKPYATFFHAAAIASAILCPIALLLPTRSPRGSRAGRFKPTAQNLLLGGGAFWGFDRLAADYTGQSISSRSIERWGAVLGVSSSTSSSSAAAADGDGKKNSAEAGAGSGGKSAGGGLFGHLPTERAERNRALMEAERKRRAEAEGREYKPRKGGSGEDGRGWWQRVWMGGEKDGWQEKRLEEERQALESGKGYGDLIVEQVKEVWNGEGKKGGEDKGGDGKK